MITCIVNTELGFICIELYRVEEKASFQSSVFENLNRDGPCVILMYPLALVLYDNKARVASIELELQYHIVVWLYYSRCLNNDSISIFCVVVTIYGSKCFVT